MTIKYGKFEMPKEITLEKETATNTFARFIAEPFEKGYGHTIGISLRRMLLTSLEAPAIIGIRIEGVHHENTAIEGVIEDMTNIILNLKGALLRKLPIEAEEDFHGTRILTTLLHVTKEKLDKNNGEVKVKFGEITTKVLVNKHILVTVHTGPGDDYLEFELALNKQGRYLVVSEYTDF